MHSFQLPAILATRAPVAGSPWSTRLTSLCETRESPTTPPLPEGVLNVITGSGGVVGDSLVSHKLVNLITLTGSTATGEHVAKIAGMKRMHLELGGKGSAIVAP